MHWQRFLEILGASVLAGSQTFIWLKLLLPPHLGGFRK
jgi:hypothetical protein